MKNDKIFKQLLNELNQQNNSQSVLQQIKSKVLPTYQRIKSAAPSYLNRASTLATNLSTNVRNRLKDINKPQRQTSSLTSLLPSLQKRPYNFKPAPKPVSQVAQNALTYNPVRSGIVNAAKSLNRYAGNPVGTLKRNLSRDINSAKTNVSNTINNTKRNVSNAVDSKLTNIGNRVLNVVSPQHRIQNAVQAERAKQLENQRRMLQRLNNK